MSYTLRCQGARRAPPSRRRQLRPLTKPPPADMAGRAARCRTRSRAAAYARQHYSPRGRHAGVSGRRLRRVISFDCCRRGRALPPAGRIAKRAIGSACRSLQEMIEAISPSLIWRARRQMPSIPLPEKVTARYRPMPTPTPTMPPSIFDVSRQNNIGHRASYGFPDTATTPPMSLTSLYIIARAYRSPIPIRLPMAGHAALHCRARPPHGFRLPPTMASVTRRHTRRSEAIIFSSISFRAYRALAILADFADRLFRTRAFAHFTTADTRRAISQTRHYRHSRARLIREQHAAAALSPFRLLVDFARREISCLHRQYRVGMRRSMLARRQCSARR